MSNLQNDLTGYYFQSEDYEIFSEQNAKISNFEINQRRKEVQQKMIAIHNHIYSTIKNLGISCHKRDDNLTSMISLNEYNSYSVEFICVRYGKFHYEIERLNFGKDSKDPSYGFQKHGHLQYCIRKDCFDINFLWAVKNEAVDRMKLKEKNFKIFKERRSDITNAIENLVGHGFKWFIENENKTSFCFDQRPPEEFFNWFKINDKDGFKSLLNKHYEPDDPILKNKQSIADEVIRVMTIIKPFYDSMVWRIPIE